MESRRVADEGRAVRGIEIGDVVRCMARRVDHLKIAASERERLSSF